MQPAALRLDSKGRFQILLAACLGALERKSSAKQVPDSPKAKNLPPREKKLGYRPDQVADNVKELCLRSWKAAVGQIRQ